MFGLFTRKMQATGPSEPRTFQPNTTLKEAVARHNDEPSNKYILRSLYRSLGQGFLMIFVDQAPSVNAAGMVERDASVKTMSTTSPAGGLALVVFTDPAEAFKRVGSKVAGGVIALSSHDALKQALDSGNDGVLINPAGPWAFVPRSVLQEIVKGRYA